MWHYCSLYHTNYSGLQNIHDWQLEKIYLASCFDHAFLKKPESFHHHLGDFLENYCPSFLAPLAMRWAIEHWWILADGVDQTFISRNYIICKFLLGVNSKAGNTPCMSELGRFPVGINIIGQLFWESNSERCRYRIKKAMPKWIQKATSMPKW
jgi:hypothetical protein